MQRDPVVLIEVEFWEMIGGAGRYGMLVNAGNAIGGRDKERIYREITNIAPLHHADFSL